MLSTFALPFPRCLIVPLGKNLKGVHIVSFPLRTHTHAHTHTRTRIQNKCVQCPYSGLLFIRFQEFNTKYKRAVPLQWASAGLMPSTSTPHWHGRLRRLTALLEISQVSIGGRQARWLQPQGLGIRRRCLFGVFYLRYRCENFVTQANIHTQTYTHIHKRAHMTTYAPKQQRRYPHVITRALGAKNKMLIFYL